MARHTFYILDVFAEQKYAGNQLAVFRDAGTLSDAEMQQIAKEMHFSETTFILSEEKRNGGHDVRIFTPEHEILFAGHPTLGTAYVIQQEIVKKPVETVILNLKVGQIPVTFKYSGGQLDMMWMKQINPIFGAILDAQSLSLVLRIDKREIDDRFPIQEISTGTAFIMVPLKSLDAVRKSQIDKTRYFDLIENIDAKAILVFCPETLSKDNDLHVRVFVDYYGIPEDPATGSGNGCLAGYLVEHRYFGNDRIDTRVEQGYEIGRPSLLFLRAEKKEGKIDVFVGGKVQMIAKGEFI
ncbi:MAG: PhzF family phenazine biosynthesis protein [Candidatus Zixiibacteriota bacterium]